jgi:hypothetical protein
LKPIRCKKYLEYIRKSRCCVSKATWDQHGRPNVAAHVRIGNDGGMGMKPSDTRTVPLTANLHDKQHQVGERTFWQAVNIDPQDVIIRHLMGFIGDKTAVIEALEALIVKDPE